MAGLVTLYCRAVAVFVADISCVDLTTCGCKKTWLYRKTGSFPRNVQGLQKQPALDPSETEEAQRVLRYVGLRAKT